METKTYYTDRRIGKLAAYLIKTRIPFYCDGRIIEFETTPAKVRIMQEEDEELALTPFVVK